LGAEAERHRGAPRVALADEADLVRTLFREYVGSLGVDLSFQGFEEELAALPDGYDVILLAGADGCVGVRPFEDGVCEMKRLYVRPAARGMGLGRTLAVAAVEHARTLGYRAMRLDTMPMMGSAQALYESLGFAEITPYRHNPVAGTRFMELDLRLPPDGS
jgi:ribosomal protein S18 acetylase RimI-like enzyme